MKNIEVLRIEYISLVFLLRDRRNVKRVYRSRIKKTKHFHGQLTNLYFDTNSLSKDLCKYSLDEKNNPS